METSAKYIRRLTASHTPTHTDKQTLSITHTHKPTHPPIQTHSHSPTHPAISRPLDLILGGEYIIKLRTAEASELLFCQGECVWYLKIPIIVALRNLVKDDDVRVQVSGQEGNQV